MPRQESYEHRSPAVLGQFTQNHLVVYPIFILMSIIFLKICNLVLSSIFFGWLPFKDINSANTSLIIRKCKFKCDNFTGVVGQQRIPKIFLEDFLFPIPPISEQRRIANQIKPSRTSTIIRITPTKSSGCGYARKVGPTRPQ